MPTISKKIAVCLVKFTENPGREPDPVSYFEDLVIRDGTDNLNGYIKYLTFGKINLNASRIFGWKNIPVSAASMPPERHLKIEIIKRHFPELRDFAPDSCIMVFNTNTKDGGASGDSVLCDYADVNPHHRRMTFVAHELLHTFGLSHSHDLSERKTSWQIGEYLDYYDIMSAEFCYSFGGGTAIDNANKFGNKGPLMNAPFLAMKGWLNPAQIELIDERSRAFEFKTTTLDSLSLRRPTGTHKLAVKIPTSTEPDTQLKDFWVELRTKESWDAGIKENAPIIIRRFKENNTTYAINKEHSLEIERNQGDIFMDFKNNFRVEIITVNPTDKTAVVKTGPLFNSGITIPNSSNFYSKNIQGASIAVTSDGRIIPLTINSRDDGQDFDKAFFKVSNAGLIPFTLMSSPSSVSARFTAKKTIKGGHPDGSVIGWFGASVQGGGITVADISGNGTDDLIVFHVDNPFDENAGYYRIGWDLNPDTGDVVRWSNAIKLPYSFGVQNRGCSIAIGNLKPTTKDIIVSSIDQTFNEYHAVYRIGKNVNNRGEVTGGWSGAIAVPAKGKVLKNASAVLTSLVNPAQKDLLYYYTEESESNSIGKFIVGWDIGPDGTPRKGWSRTFELINKGWKATENQVSSITIRNKPGGKPDLLLFNTVLNPDNSVGFGYVSVAINIGF